MKILSLFGLLGATLLLSGCLKATFAERRPVHRRTVIHHDARHDDHRHYDVRRTYHRGPAGRSRYYRPQDDRDHRSYHRTHDGDDDDDRRTEKARLIIVRPGY